MLNIWWGLIVTVIPFGVLALGGILLWRRCRSLPTALMGLGFTVLFVACLMGYLSGVWLIISTYQSLGLVLNHLAELGQWVAGVGLVWHALRRWPSSSNNRFERTARLVFVDRRRESMMCINQPRSSVALPLAAQPHR